MDPNRLYVSQTSGLFGQIIQRSHDGAKTWNPPENRLPAAVDTGAEPLLIVGGMASG